MNSIENARASTIPTYNKNNNSIIYQNNFQHLGTAHQRVKL